MATEEFGAMFEESLQQVEPPETGEIIKTSVIDVTKEVVILDVGAKSEAQVPVNEFKEVPQIGDEIEVLVERASLGNIKVSFKKAAERQIFLKIKEASESGEAVKAKVADVVKGGFKVMLEGHINAFLPLSQVALRRVNDPEQFKGQSFEVEIIRFEKKGRNLNIVVSRRTLLEKVQAEKAAEFYEKIEVGQELDAKVVRVNPKSVIVEVDEMETGLIRIGDLSWDRINHPRDIVQVGDVVRVKVLEFDAEKRNLLLSIKDTKEDPWVLFAQNHSVNDMVKGQVVKVTNRVVFVKLEEGVEGVIRFENLSWSRGIKKPEDVVQENTEVQVQILTIDPENKKLSLGLKQVEGDPWAEISAKYPVGKKVKGTITGKQEFGLFVEIEAGVEALLHKNDIDWNQKNIDLEQYNIGDEIESIVLKIDVNKRKMNLGIKQLFDNPWENFASEYPKNSVVKGKVKEVQSEGLVMDYGNEIEGFLHKSQLSEKVENLEGKFNVGDEVEAMVTDINAGRNLLRVSVRAMIERAARKEVEKYMDQEEEEVTGATLGDFFGKNLDKFKKEDKAAE